MNHRLKVLVSFAEVRRMIAIKEKLLSEKKHLEEKENPTPADDIKLTRIQDILEDIRTYESLANVTQAA